MKRLRKVKAKLRRSARRRIEKRSKIETLPSGLDGYLIPFDELV